MKTKRELEIQLAAASEEFARYDERLAHLGNIRRRLDAVLDTLYVTQQDLIHWKQRAEVAEQRVIELKAAFNEALNYAGRAEK